MSMHPNTLLMTVLESKDSPRLLMKNILSFHGNEDFSIEKDEDEEDDLDSIKIGKESFNPLIMENDYNEDLGISAPEGSIVFWEAVTYGYGETIEWPILELRKNNLEIWSIEMCTKFGCTYSIEVLANYW